MWFLFVAAACSYPWWDLNAVRVVLLLLELTGYDQLGSHAH